jgi:integrase
MAEATIRARLSKKLVDSVVPPPQGEFRIWDTSLRGFLLRVWPSGRKTYCLKARVGSQQRWITIGEHGLPWTPEQARDKSLELLTAISRGEDPTFVPIPQPPPVLPVIEEIASKEQMTVRDLYQLYMKEGPNDKPLKRESSWGVDRSCYLRHIEPLLGDRIAAHLRPADLSAFQAKVAAGATSADIKTKKQGRAIVTGGTGIAARAMRCLSAMLNWAIWREILKENPAKHVQKYRDQERDRPLTEVEARTVWSTLDEAEKSWILTRDMADIIRLIMLTGARRNEIGALSWDEVDLDRSRLVLPPVRTKMGGLNKSRIIALSDPARTILEARAPGRGRWVFMSQRVDKPLVGVTRAWIKVRTIIGLHDVRLHDLRHSFATFAVESGASIYVVGKSLGHAKMASTERYAHVGDLPQRSVADLVAARILGPLPRLEAAPAEATTTIQVVLPETVNGDKQGSFDIYDVGL